MSRTPQRSGPKPISTRLEHCFLCLVFQKGEVQPMSVKVGEKVLLPEYGGTKVVLEDKVSSALDQNLIP